MSESPHVVRPGDERWPVAVAAVLTFGTGALDVLALVHLGGVFASVMTGNLTLLGLGIARADTSALIHTAVALLGYVAGVAVGSRTTGASTSGHLPSLQRVRVVLGVELLLLGGLTVGWVATGADPRGGVQVALLAAAAGSMGLQSAAARGLGAAVATTYLTGTLTAVVAAWTGAGERRGHAPGIATLVAVIAGAACGGVVLRTAPVATPALTLVPLAVALVILNYGRPLPLPRGRRRRSPRT